jgi:hypothetical protein
VIAALGPADPAVHHLLRVAGALLFGAAALHKLRNRRAFREALAGYRLLPRALLAPAALALPALEGALAGALLTPGLARAGALAGAGLLSVYAAAIAANLARGRRRIDCGCGGPGGRQTLGPGLLWRNAGLVALFWLAARPVAARPWTWIDGVTVLAGVATLALVYASLDVLLANRERSRGPEPVEAAWATR